MGQPVKVAGKSELREGQGISVEAAGKRLAIFLVNGSYYAIDDECTHAGGSLAEGSLRGTTVMCPLHGAEFDITTGKAIGEPADTDVGKYKVVVTGDNIMVEI